MVTERLDAEQDDCRLALDSLSRGAARTRILVESILHDASSRDRRPSVEPVDLAVTVRESFELLAPQISDSHATFEVGEMPIVTGERAPLGSVFTNLIVNAIKYSPRGASVVRIAAQRETACWRITVESGGPTLDSEERERIFGPFSRARGERRAHGNGLGLAICRSIVERHGGTIGVSPGRNGGNCFFFTLPAH
jgi:signal transduction histidine kinase